MSDIQALFDSTADLPMLPKVVEEFLRLLDTEDPDLKEVINVINHDPVIAAKVLRQANTAQYGTARQIKTLEEAVAILGLAKLVTLVIASGVTESITNVPNINMPYFWRRSFVCAAIARQLALTLNQEMKTTLQPELIYLGGLLHAIGQVVMHLFFPNAETAIMMADLADSPAARKKIEHDTLGVDHCLIGQELVRRWFLPTEIQHMVRHYAEPKGLDVDMSASIVHLSAHIGTDLILNRNREDILGRASGSLAKIVAPNTEVWQSRLNTYASFLTEADAFI